MCEYCDKDRNDYPMKPCANGDMGAEAMLFKATDGPGIVFMVRNVAFGNFDIEYCPMCGRSLISG